MLLKSIFVLCAFLNCNVCGQICRKRTVVTKLVYEDYRYSYEERFSKKNWYGRTIYKTRIKTALGTRPVPKQEVDFVPTCCDGYIRTDSGSLDDIECTPICTPSCVNGKCVSPGECECDTGYVLDVGSPHKCLPTCEACTHGTCVAPNVCHCNYGYSIQNGTSCLPICTEACINSVCVAPDTCECLYGYRKTDSNICSPYCSQGCQHGTCTEPETCTCFTGYQKKEIECVPKCDTQCGNGTCIAPNQCKCNEGYEVDEDNDPVCVPHCNVTCGNGSCVAPDTCNCDAGYNVDNSKEPLCVPKCETECGNGSCVAPNECQCNAGYKLNRGSNPMCAPQCDVQCGNGNCIAPNICECEIGYKQDKNKEPICVPHCENECRNGLCAAPNNCKCNAGYQISNDTFTMCVPKCDIACGNGNCVAPNTCVCDNGFELNEGNNPACLPKCDVRCDNGSCIAPNVCECFPGYKINKDKRCVQDCGECEGNCDVVGKCVCDEPFKPIHVTADGIECNDKIDNCTRIICKLDAVTATEGISYGYDDIDTNASIEPRSTSDSTESEVYWFDYHEGVLTNDTIEVDPDVENQMQGSEYWMRSKWEYAVITIVVIILAIVLGSVVIFWASLKNCCKTGGDYTVEDKNIEEARNPKRLSEEKIRMSTILQKRAEEDSGNELQRK